MLAELHPEAITTAEKNMAIGCSSGSIRSPACVFWFSRYIRESCPVMFLLAEIESHSCTQTCIQAITIDPRVLHPRFEATGVRRH